MEALIEIVNSQYENDLVMKTELNRLKVNLSNLKTQVRGTDIAYERSLNYLKILMGMSMDTEIEVKEEKLDNLSMTALGADSETPTDISILQKQKSLQALSVSNVKAGYVPQLSAFAQHSWQALRNEFNLFDSDQPWFASTIVGLQLSVPIFDGFQKHHKIQQEKIALEKLEIDIRNTEQMLNMQEINAKRQLQNSFDAVAAQKENRDLADEVYEQTRQRYKQNIATMPDLIDAENAYISAQNNYINELIAFHKAELELLKAKGILLEKLKK
jgi:outer membrane protein TolC